MRKLFSILLLSLGLLLQTSPAPLHALALGPGGLVPVSIPLGAVPVIPVSQTDLDGDGTPETLALSGGRLSILSGDEIAWQSPSAWQVVQAEFGDLNRDGQPEVALLLWRPFRPWPVDQWLPHGGRIAGFQDAEGRSCHVILIGWTGLGYNEAWAGSAMADPIKFFTLADLDGDAHQEMVVLEGRYTDPGPVPACTLKVWEWNGFGFSSVSSMEGAFTKLTLVQADDSRTLILVP